MTADPATPLARCLRRVAADTDPDGRLLDRFRTGRDEAAFAELVARHARMVFGVCRRVLGNVHDAEDAFQAAFVVLVRRAGDLTGRDTVGDWLYGVAYRTALKARANAVKRRTKEAAAGRPIGMEPPGSDDAAVVDAELAALPAKYREPLVLCELEGRPRKEVAAALGVPEGTLSSRLAMGKRMLADRLRRRGFAAGAGVLGSAGVAGAVPPGLIESTVRSAIGAVPVAVAKLAAEVTTAIFLTKLRVGVVVLAAVLLGGAVGLTVLSHVTAAPDQPQSEKQQPANPPAAKADEPAWMAAFVKDYGLKDGQNLKLIPVPFPASREPVFESLPRTGQPSERMMMAVEQDGRRLKLRSIASRFWVGPAPGGDQPGWSLGKHLWHGLGILPQEIEGDEKLLATLVDADIVVRKGAAEDRLLKDLQTELRDRFSVRVKFEMHQEEREVVIARGKYTLKQGPDDEQPTVDVYAREPLAEPSAVYSSGPKYLLQHLGEFINRRVIDQTDRPSPNVAVRQQYHQRLPATAETATEDTDPEKVLKNVSAQTGLTFTTAKRKVRVLFVEKAEK